MTAKQHDNTAIVKLLESAAAAYKIKDKNKFRFQIIAYERAADAVEHLGSEAKDLWDDGKLQKVAGIGPSIASHLGEIFTKGKSDHFKKLFKGIPPAVFDLLPLEGVGPSLSMKLVSNLQIKQPNSVNKLLKLAQKGRVATLEGFGEDSQNSIIQSIKEFKKRKKRLLLNYALDISDSIVNWMKKIPEVDRVETLGSLRRKAPTIGDIDIACSTDNPKNTIEHFCDYPNKTRVIEKGAKTASIMLPNNVHIDLMIAGSDDFGSVLQHFTGSKQHNIHLREHALKKGLSLSEYGIRKVQRTKCKEQSKKKKTKIQKFKNEEELYKFLGMDWIPPELREGKDELKAAQNNKLPNLIGLQDVKADLQVHSVFNTETNHDLGMSSYQELAKKADELGYEYIALTDHNPSRGGHSKNQITNILKKKKDSVDKFNKKINSFGYKNLKHIYNSMEVDIMSDGSLPLTQADFELMDFVLVSIHSSFRQSKKVATDRVLKAFNNPKVKIFAHPTGRKLNVREGVDLDWEKIFEFAIKRNIWMEINADPMRLDLPDHLIYTGIQKGVKFSMGTDAHHANHMDNMKYSVHMARRGWVAAADVVNCKTFEQFNKMIKL